MTFDDRLAVLRTIEVPIWLIDYMSQKMIWGNPKAIELWCARDLEDLLLRDFTKTSDAVRARHIATQKLIEAGGSETRLITFYPDAQGAITVRCHLSGFKLDDGRVITLTQALDTQVAIDSEQLRGVEAIRRVSAMVTLLDESGSVLMHNPAAAQAFGMTTSVLGCFADETVAQAIQGIFHTRNAFRDDALVDTAAGRRWHAVEGYCSVDPVTGKPALLLLQIDVTEGRELREMLEDQARQIQVLSTPILGVGSNVLAVPVIGRLDDARGRLLASKLLDEVVARAASTVILDLTGIDSLDVVGVDMLMKVARALQLLGVRPILTGIQPDLAAKLVATGSDLRGILTLPTLREGLLRSRES